MLSASGKYRTIELTIYYSNKAQNNNNIIIIKCSFLNYRDCITDTILYYVRALIELGKPEHAITIVKALPLYNFLSNDSKPYQQLQVSLLEGITWGDPSFMLSKLRMNLEEKGYKILCKCATLNYSLQIYSKI